MNYPKDAEILCLIPVEGIRRRDLLEKTKEIEIDGKHISSRTLNKRLIELENLGKIKKEQRGPKEVWYYNNDNLIQMINRFNKIRIAESMPWYLMDLWLDIITALAKITEEYNLKPTNKEAAAYFESETGLTLMPILQKYIEIFNPGNGDMRQGIKRALYEFSIPVEKRSMEIGRAETGFVQGLGPDRYDRKYDPEKGYTIRTLKKEQS